MTFVPLNSQICVCGQRFSYFGVLADNCISVGGSGDDQRGPADADADADDYVDDYVDDDTAADDDDEVFADNRNSAGLGDDQRGPAEPLQIV